MGHVSLATGEKALALGANSDASGAKSMAIGSTSIANGEDSISIGDKVDVIRQAYIRKDTGEPDTLGSKVIDIIDDITFKLTMPMNKTITIALEVGEESYMYFYTVY